MFLPTELKGEMAASGFWGLESGSEGPQHRDPPPLAQRVGSRSLEAEVLSRWGLWGPSLHTAGSRGHIRLGRTQRRVRSEEPHPDEPCVHPMWRALSRGGWSATSAGDWRAGGGVGAAVAGGRRTCSPSVLKSTGAGAAWPRERGGGAALGSPWALVLGQSFPLPSAPCPLQQHSWEFSPPATLCPVLLPAVSLCSLLRSSAAQLSLS